MADFGGDSFVLFLSTPSARRATGKKMHDVSFDSISIHALREEGDAREQRSQNTIGISIHALREEGDQDFLVGMGDTLKFLSTPSARRATIRP